MGDGRNWGRYDKRKREVNGEERGRGTEYGEEVVGTMIKGNWNGKERWGGGRIWDPRDGRRRKRRGEEGRGRGMAANSLIMS